VPESASAADARRAGGGEAIPASVGRCPARWSIRWPGVPSARSAKRKSSQVNRSAPRAVIQPSGRITTNVCSGNSASGRRPARRATRRRTKGARPPQHTRTRSPKPFGPAPPPSSPSRRSPVRTARPNRTGDPSFRGSVASRRRTRCPRHRPPSRRRHRPLRRDRLQAQHPRRRPHRPLLRVGRPVRSRARSRRSPPRSRGRSPFPNPAPARRRGRCEPPPRPTGRPLRRNGKRRLPHGPNGRQLLPRARPRSRSPRRRPPSDARNPSAWSRRPPLPRPR